jgi:hypothetical protein
MASPSTVLTRGYGSWGTVNALPTLGYGISADVATVHTATGTWEVPARTGTWQVPARAGTWEVPSRTGTWEVPE